MRLRHTIHCLLIGLTATALAADKPAGKNINKRGENPKHGDDNAIRFSEFIKTVPPLKQPLGEFPPIYCWVGPLNEGETDWKTYYTECWRRGYMPLIWLSMNPQEVEALRPQFNALKELGLPVAILGRGWGQNVSQRLKAQGNDKCLAFADTILAKEKQNIVGHIAALRANSVTVNMVHFDWELWLRARPDELRQLASGTISFKRFYEQEVLTDPKCPKTPKDNYSSFENFVIATELARARIIREAYVEPFKAYNPKLEIGNYFTMAHTRNDQPLVNPKAAVGWYRSGVDFSMPVVYMRMEKHMKHSPQIASWNFFRVWINEVSESSRCLVGSEYQLPYIKNVVDPAKATDLTQMTRESYRELIWHLRLRGCRTFHNWLARNHAKVHKGQVDFFTEMIDHGMVINEIWPYRDIVLNGKIMTLENAPGEYNRLDGAVVWSGMQTETKALIRAVSFTGKKETVTVDVFGRKRTLDAPPEGKTHFDSPRP